MKSNVAYESLREARTFIDNVPDANDPWRLAGFIDEIKAEERAKWLPLWEAVKELEKVDDFWAEHPDRYKTDFWGDSDNALSFKGLGSIDQQQVIMARREIHRVLLVLRSQGER